MHLQILGSSASTPKKRTRDDSLTNDGVITNEVQAELDAAPKEKDDRVSKRARGYEAEGPRPSTLEPREWEQTLSILGRLINEREKLGERQAQVDREIKELLERLR